MKAEKRADLPAGDALQDRGRVLSDLPIQSVGKGKGWPRRVSWGRDEEAAGDFAWERGGAGEEK